MREHLYRGKRIDNGEWVYGNLYEAKISGCYILAPRIKARKKDGVVIGDYFDVYEVYPETICEYTGLTDKNGNKIFEGDIVKTKYYGKDSGCGQNFNEYDYFTVVFHEASFCIENATRRFIITAESAKRFEIIGNIYDNPKLIKKRGEE